MFLNLSMRLMSFSSCIILDSRCSLRAFCDMVSRMRGRAWYSRCSWSHVLLRPWTVKAERETGWSDLRGLLTGPAAEWRPRRCAGLPWAQIFASQWRRVSLLPAPSALGGSCCIHLELSARPQGASASIWGVSQNAANSTRTFGFHPIKTGRLLLFFHKHCGLKKTKTTHLLFRVLGNKPWILQKLLVPLDGVDTGRLWLHGLGGDCLDEVPFGDHAHQRRSRLLGNRRLPVTARAAHFLGELSPWQREEFI